MAAIYIHDDCEKENPQIAEPLKEKACAPPIAKSALPAEKLGGTSKLAETAGGNKIAFRDVRNVQPYEGASTFTSSSVAVKRTVVGQFKAFSVYEDQPEGTSRQQVKQHVTTNASSSDVLANTKKCDIEKTHQENVCASNLDTSVLKEYVFKVQKISFDKSPPKESTADSPISLERSPLLSVQNSASKTTDDNKLSDLYKDGDVPQHLVPRNDRQRFYEVVDYQQNILEYLREIEQRRRPKPQYMLSQADLTVTMRTILIEWMVEVSQEYNLDDETLYLSVSFIDRFLSSLYVIRDKLQLVGTAAIYIASKYVEVYPPHVDDFVYITDDTYTRGQVLRTEKIMLKILNFSVCTPTANDFINMYSVLVDMPDQLKFLTKYICELTLLEAEPYLRYYPSLISAAAHALARLTLNYKIWSTALQNITTYDLENMKEVINHLCKSHNNARTSAQQAIQEKYKDDKFLKVSDIKPINLDDLNFDEMTYKDSIKNDEGKKEMETTALEVTNDRVRCAYPLMY